MKKLFPRILLFTLIITLLAQPLNLTAWNDTGHMVIGAIAWEHLTDTTKERVIEILLDAPEDSDMLDLYEEGNEQAAKIYFTRANYWSDIVRDRDERDRWEKYHKGAWHYVGTYWKQTEIGPEKTTGFKADENVVERIEYFRQTLSTEDSSEFHPAVELAWVFHLVGDIHMPLHNTSRVTKDSPDGDRGGNDFKLGDNEYPMTNLHAFWDGIIDIADPKIEGESEMEYIFNRADKIMKTHPKETFAGMEKTQDAEIWNMEGREITMQSVYPESLKQGEKPSAQYTLNAHKIAQQRMALSGYRMAEYLNAIFDSE